MTNSDNPDLAARIRDVVRLGEPVFALADGDLVRPDSVAVVIRDPVPGPISRLIVIARKTLTDDVVALARGALMQSEVSEPKNAQRRVITVWSDGRYEVQEGERRAHGTRSWTGPSKPTRAAELLRARSAHGTIVMIPEVGPVTICASSDG